MATYVYSQMFESAMAEEISIADALPFPSFPLMTFLFVR